MSTSSIQIVEQYRILSGDDLLKLWAESDSLTREALNALSTELQQRGLVSEEEIALKIDKYNQALRTPHSAGNSIDRAERFGISISITLGFWLLTFLITFLLRGIDDAIKVGPLTGDWPRFGFVIGLICGLIPPRWLTRRKMVLIVVIANMLWLAYLAVIVANS
jgi:hypothetical protein